MTTAVRLPPQRDGSGAVLPARVTITLVGPDRRTPVVGVLDPDLVFEACAVLIDTPAGVIVPLVPQAQIKMPGGAATHYRVVYGAPGRPDVRVVQVRAAAPDAVLELTDLLPAVELTSADILAGRVLSAAERAALDAVTAPLGPDNRVLTAADGSGGAGSVGPAGPAGPAGADGAQGPAGPTGAQGQAGPAGADGAQGPAGPAGAQGPAGPAGPAGADGAQGPAGPAGADGSAVTVLRRFAVALPYTYSGVAPGGSAEDAAVWTVVRLDFTGPVISAQATSVAWTGRASATYI